MLIENYRGVNILHDATKDEFYTNLVIRKGTMGKKDEYITSGRLQKIRDIIDRFLNTASKKPVVKKAWLKSKYESDGYKQVDIVLYNAISNTVLVKETDGKTQTINLNDYHERNGKLYLDCQENTTNISLLNKRNNEIKKIEKEVSCTGGK